MNKLFKDFPTLSNNLGLVYELIKQELQTDQVIFSEVIQPYFNENAKLIRPAFVLIASSYNQNSNSNLKDRIACASAIEILHVATLIHDDIIDNASYRRGIETINKQYDAGLAVICGDYLYAKSYHLLFKTKYINSLKGLGDSVVNMSFAEVEQYFERHNENINLEQYLNIIKNKSAVFFQSNLVLGANIANVSLEVEKLLGEFGINYGMMFQIQDDILDFTSNLQKFYKPIKNDIIKGTYTLPVIIAINKSAEFKEYLSNISADNFDIDYIIDMLDKSNAIVESIKVYNKYYNKCLKILEELTDQKVIEQLKHILDTTYERV